MIAAIVVLTALVAPAAGQASDAAVEGIRTCVAAAERDPEAERGCVGAQALACIDASPEAQTTIGMSACFAAETAAWEDVLAATDRELAAMMRDAAGPEQAGDPEALLAAAQDAWAAFRDADCKLEAAVWGEGSMRVVAAPQCAMERTAERALQLVARRRAFESP